MSTFVAGNVRLFINDIHLHVWHFRPQKIYHSLIMNMLLRNNNIRLIRDTSLLLMAHKYPLGFHEGKFAVF